MKNWNYEMGYKYLKCLTLATHAMIFALVVSLSGCNSIKKTMSMVIPFYNYDKTPINTIRVNADIDSNNNMAVAIDFVFIFNKEVNDALLKLTGPQWFENKNALLLRHRTQLTVANAEVVPLTLNETIKLPENYDNAIKVLMFANYLAPEGQYVADITQFSDLQVSLKNSGYQLKEMEP